jgi:hypothetical protein
MQDLTPMAVQTPMAVAGHVPRGCVPMRECKI